MIETISVENVIFCECLYDSLCLAESLFTNYDNLAFFEEGKLGHIRLGQIPLLSDEYMIDYNPKLSDKRNFSLKMGAGNAYILGGRNFGKTLTEKIDMIESLMLNDGFPMGITSYDAVHIRGVMEPVINCLDNHPIVSCFKGRIKRSPTYLISSKTNATIEGINMNITNKAPGNQFFQKHFKKLWIEEASFETEEVYRKRVDSRHEAGCIERATGMTNFTKYSPAGRIFYDYSKKPWVLNLPQYVNPFWDDLEKVKAVKKYGGENSAGYRVFVKGEVVEEGVSVFDMERIRPYYLEGKKLKRFEVTKKTFKKYQSFLLLEKLKNAEQIFICADIGESAPTEIIILAKIGKKYRFTHNVTLFGLTHKEQYEIFVYLTSRLEANFIGLDTTDGTGRAILRSLEEVIPKENLISCAFNEKIPVDFEKDKNGRMVYKDGQPAYIEEYVSEWSVRHLKSLLYDGKIEIPEDCYKFDVQINSIVALQSSTRTIYDCIADENHLFQAFQVFAIAEWFNAFNLVKPVITKTFSKGGV